MVVFACSIVGSLSGHSGGLTMGKRIRLSSLEGIVGNRALVQARWGSLILVALLRREVKRESEGRLKKTL